VTAREKALQVLWGFGSALLLASSCATTPAKAEAAAGHTLAETSATYRRANLVAVEGCTRPEGDRRRFPTPACQAWADFSAWAVPVLDRLEGAYLAGTTPSGPDWERLVVELFSLAAELFALASADGGAP